MSWRLRPFVTASTVRILGPAMATRMIEGARRRPVAASLACWTALLVLLGLAYAAPPFERADEDVLNAISTTSDHLVHDVAFAIEQPLDPPRWFLVGTIAFLIAVGQRRYRRAFLAAALIAGTGVLVLALKELFEHPRPLSIPAGLFEWSPDALAFPSGHSAGAVAYALAFVFVVPRSWQRATATIGVAFVLAVAIGLLVLNYHYPSDILGGWLVALGADRE